MQYVCYFCDGLFKLNGEIGVTPEESIIYEDEHIFVTPDIAPVCDGHFLIVSKEHVNSFGNANDLIFASLEKAKEYMKNHVFFGNRVLFFEHGAVLGQTAGACIDHAHMHVIPLPQGMDIEKYISEYIPYEKSEADRKSLVTCAEEKQPYMFYEISGEKPWYYSVHHSIPHQFFRRIVCGHFSVTGFRWREHYDKLESKESLQRTLQMGKRNNRLL